MAAVSAERFGHVFLFRPKDMDDERLDELKIDSKSIQDTFKYLGFNASIENRNEVIEKKEDLEKHLQQSVDPMASVIFFYIFANVVKKGKIHLLDKDSRMLLLEDVMKIFAERENKDTKIVIFLQELISRKEKKNAVLYNKIAKGDSAKKIPEYQYILMPQNMLLATLPEKVDESSNLVKILCEELRKAKDIDSALTSMIREATKMDADFYSMFSSTMNQSLSMEDWGKKNLKTPLKTKEVRVCLCAWLIGTFPQFDEEDQLGTTEDEKFIRETFENYGKIISIKTGNVGAPEIIEKIEPVQDCEFLVLIISSHGLEGGIIHTSDGGLTWEEFFDSIKHLEDIPKLIIGDLCRGTCKGTDSVPKRKESITRGPAMLPLNLPKNTMMIFASTEGAMSYQVGTEGKTSSNRSALINTFCSILKKDYFKGQGKNLFTLTHETMIEVQKIYESKEAKKAERIQQVTFASTMPDVYRFKYNAIN